MKLLYAGFDTIDVALQGAFPPETIELLKEARYQAAERQEAVLVRIGPGRVAMHVEASGLRGGYAIRADTGPLGEVLAFKANTDPQEWNGFASIRASTLAAYGYHAARGQLFARLADLGFRVIGYSVNRIDYAADFLAPGFELRLDGFTAHPRAKVRPHWSAESHSDRNQPSAVLSGRRLESVTIGKMPGRQIIVYDKRREALDKRKFFWFKLWGIDPHDSATNVHRIEVRAGRKELKDRWGIRTFADVETCAGDMVRHALNEIRYLAPMQNDSNVTRQQIDPLWQAMIEQVERGLFDFRAGILPSQIKELEREQAIETYTNLLVGIAAPLAVALDLANDQIETRLPPRMVKLLLAAITDRNGRFQKRIDRARERLHFVCDPSP